MRGHQQLDYWSSRIWLAKQDRERGALGRSTQALRVGAGVYKMTSVWKNTTSAKLQQNLCNLSTPRQTEQSKRKSVGCRKLCLYNDEKTLYVKNKEYSDIKTWTLHVGFYVTAFSKQINTSLGNIKYFLPNLVFTMQANRSLKFKRWELPFDLIIREWWEISSHFYNSIWQHLNIMCFIFESRYYLCMCR